MDIVLNWLIQGGLVAAAAAVALRAIPSSWTETRGGFLWTAYALVLALPAAPAVVAVLAGRAADTGATVALGPVVSMPDAWWTSAELAAAAWVLWAVASAVRLGVAAGCVRRARRECQPCPPDLETRLHHYRRVRETGRPTRVVLSTRVRSAAVLGCGSPVIALAPALVARLSDADLDRVVIHEWAHVQRRDDIAYATGLLVRIVAGWHPAVWWLERQLALEREVGCDDVVVRVTGSPKGYASCLATLAALPVAAGEGLHALAAVSPSGLRRRVVRILSSHRPRRTRAGRAVAVSASVAVFILALAVGHLHFVEALAAASRPPAAPPVTAPAGVVLAQPPLVPPAVSVPSATRRLSARSSQELTAAARPDTVATTVTASTGQIEPGPPAPVRPLEWLSDRAASSPRIVSLPGTPAAAAVDIPPASSSPGPIPPAPWTAAADAGVAIGRGSESAGVAIGRGSQKAGVATAGFFSRLGKKIAGSF